MDNDSNSEYFNQWHRVSWVAFIHFFISRGVKLFRELFVNASPALVGILVAVDDRSFWFGSAVGAIALLILTDVLIMYFTYRYRIENEQIIIKHGLFTVEVLNLKYVRIQNINNSLPWYFKPFNLLNCTFDSAGSSDKEAEIPGVTSERAELISSVINAYQAKHGVNAEDDLQTSADSELESNESNCLKLSNWEVTKFGFTNSMIFLFAGAFFPVAEKLIETTGINVTQKLSELANVLPFNQTIAMILLIILAAILFATLLLSVTAIGALITFYNFELYDEQGKLKRVSGMLERETIYLNKSKVQGVSIKQNIFARLLRRVTVVFQQVHMDVSGNAKRAAFIIPMLQPSQWQSQLKLIYPELTEIDFKFTPIARQYLYKRIVYGVLLPVSIVVGLFMLLIDWRLVILGLVSLPMIFVAYLRYKKYGYMELDDYLIIREGLIGTNIHILHRFKTQHMVEVSSPSQRQLGLASMKVQMAFSKLTLPYISLDKVKQNINRNLYLAETSSKHWM